MIQKAQLKLNLQQAELIMRLEKLYNLLAKIQMEIKVN